MFVLCGKIDDALAGDLIKKMLDYSKRKPESTITLYISCDGGSITAGVAIYDVIRFVPNPICTIAVENAMGIATLILAAGTKGMRYAYRGVQIG